MTFKIFNNQYGMVLTRALGPVSVAPAVAGCYDSVNNCEVEHSVPEGSTKDHKRKYTAHLDGPHWGVCLLGSSGRVLWGS